MSCQSWPPMPIIRLGVLAIRGWHNHNAHIFCTYVSFLILSQTIIGTGFPGLSAPAGAQTQGISMSRALPCYRLMQDQKWLHPGGRQKLEIYNINTGWNNSFALLLVTEHHVQLSPFHTHTHEINRDHACFVQNSFKSNVTVECCTCDNTCHCLRDWIILVNYTRSRHISP